MPAHKCSVRWSDTPCPWCGERYVLQSSRQKVHTQSEWCRKQERNTQALTFYFERQREKQIAERRAKRTRKYGENHFYRQVDVPIAFAMRTAQRKGFSWLLRLHKDDAIQQLRLALLEFGISNLDQPTTVDVAELINCIRRHLYRLALDLGAHYDRDTHKFYDVCFELDPKRITPNTNWQAVWRAA